MVSPLEYIHYSYASYGCVTLNLVDLLQALSYIFPPPRGTQLSGRDHMAGLLSIYFFCYELLEQSYRSEQCFEVVSVEKKVAKTGKDCHRATRKKWGKKRLLHHDTKKTEVEQKLKTNGGTYRT